MLCLSDLGSENYTLMKDLKGVYCDNDDNDDNDDTDDTDDTDDNDDNDSYLYFMNDYLVMCCAFVSYC